MQTDHEDWPTSLEAMWDSWAPRDHSEHTLLVQHLASGLVNLVTLLYRDGNAFDERCRAYVSDALERGRPAWAAAGRAVWSMGLWRQGDEDSSLLQVVLAELELQEELRQPRPDPFGGPTGPSAASNNLGMAYANMRMFELSIPHLQRAARLSEDLYGPQLRLQVAVDYANLAEVGVRWALNAEAVGRTSEALQRSLVARGHARTSGVVARQLERPDAERYARALLIGARSLSSPGEISTTDREALADITAEPIFGDEPAEIVIRAVESRVCRLTGDSAGCHEAAARARALSGTGDATMLGVALREAALLERPEEYTWTYMHAMAAQTESARRRAVAAFRTRLALAGLEHRFEQVSADRQRLQQKLEEAARGEAELLHAATHDDLTGLPNRTLFLQRLDGALQTGSAVMVAFVEVDDLKAVNTQHGHQMGDAVLSGVAAVLRSTVRATDTVARLSGDEFAVLMVSHTSSEAAQLWAERLNVDLANPAEATPPVTVSVGICLVTPGSNPTLDQVLHAVDGHMFAAKRHGKGRAVMAELS